MKKYRLIIPIFASFSVEVVAEDEDVAINKYLSGELNIFVPSLCSQCSNEIALGDIDSSADVNGFDSFPLYRLLLHLVHSLSFLT